MRPSRRPIVIATRTSRLAQAQSRAIGAELQRLHPAVKVELLLIESEGDKAGEGSLAGMGGKGLFTRAIEAALLEGRADIAVHSMKDLPVELTAGLVIAAIPPRADVRDALIASAAGSIEELARGATVGTSSLRRAAQLRRLRPDLKIVALRGNIDTRLRKVLEERVVEATLLAMAGLERAGLGEYAVAPVPLEQVLPAAAQGALAVQCRADDHVTLRRCLPLNDGSTAVAVHAERQVVEKLAGNCTSPMAVLAQVTGTKQLRLRARVLSPDGLRLAEADRSGAVRSVRDVCERVYEDLIAQGAREILDLSPSPSPPPEP